MKILMVHNFYAKKSGEDISYTLERKILLEKGNIVIDYIKRSNKLNQLKLKDILDLILNSIWSWQTKKDIKEIIKRERPDIVHIQNTFPLISPSIYKSCKDENIPVIQALRNYRMINPEKIDFINNLRKRRFEEIVKNILKCSVFYIHRVFRTYKKIDGYIALTEFVKNEYLKNNFEKEKIFVKPNFIEKPKEIRQKKDYAIYIGRLSREKGIFTLISAWEDINYPLKIIGTGPLEREIKEIMKNKPKMRIQLLGEKNHQEAMKLLSEASILIIPSEWNEPFGRVAIEGFANKTLVLSTQSGGLKELVKNEQTGLTFQSGNVQDLKSKIRIAITKQEKLKEIINNAYKEYLRYFTPKKNYLTLMNIYEKVLKTHEKTNFNKN